MAAVEDLHHRDEILNEGLAEINGHVAREEVDPADPNVVVGQPANEHILRYSNYQNFIYMSLINQMFYKKRNAKGSSLKTSRYRSQLLAKFSWIMKMIQIESFITSAGKECYIDSFVIKNTKAFQIADIESTDDTTYDRQHRNCQRNTVAFSIMVLQRTTIRFNRTLSSKKNYCSTGANGEIEIYKLQSSINISFLQPFMDSLEHEIMMLIKKLLMLENEAADLREYFKNVFGLDIIDNVINFNYNVNTKSPTSRQFNTSNNIFNTMIKTLSLKIVNQYPNINEWIKDHTRLIALFILVISFKSGQVLRFGEIIKLQNFTDGTSSNITNGLIYDNTRKVFAFISNKVKSKQVKQNDQIIVLFESNLQVVILIFVIITRIHSIILLNLIKKNSLTTDIKKLIAQANTTYLFKSGKSFIEPVNKNTVKEMLVSECTKRLIIAAQLDIQRPFVGAVLNLLDIRHLLININALMKNSGVSSYIQEKLNRGAIGDTVNGHSVTTEYETYISSHNVPNNFREDVYNSYFQSYTKKKILIEIASNLETHLKRFQHPEQLLDQDISQRRAHIAANSNNHDVGDTDGDFEEDGYSDGGNSGEDGYSDGGYEDGIGYSDETGDGNEQVKIKEESAPMANIASTPKLVRSYYVIDLTLSDDESEVGEEIFERPGWGGNFTSTSTGSSQNGRSPLYSRGLKKPRRR